MIIDTGLTIHRAQIHAALERLLAGKTQCSLFMTRREPDAIINLPFFVQTLGINKIYCAGILDPLDFFERFDQGNIEGCISAMARMSVSWAPAGQKLSVGPFQVTPLQTLLAVLPKSHLYEAQTRTLFGSDSWGFLTQPVPFPLARQRDPACFTRDVIADYLAFKFDWLLGIDTSPIIADVQKLLELDIQRICGSYGSVIEGVAAVRRLLDETLAALRLLAHRPAPDRLRGFNKMRFINI